LAASDETKMGTFDRMKNKVHGEEAMGQAMAEIANDHLEERLASLGKDDEIEKLIADIKAKREGLPEKAEDLEDNAYQYAIYASSAAEPVVLDRCSNGGKQARLFRQIHSKNNPIANEVARIGGRHPEDHFDPAARLDPFPCSKQNAGRTHV